MTISTIMVHVDFDEATKARVAAAADLARRFHAALIGVAGWALRELDTGSEIKLDSPRLGASAQDRIAEQLERLGESFRKMAGEVPMGLEWQFSDHFPREVIPAHAFAADLVVIGQPMLPGDLYQTFDPGQVILTAGRPVLVLPPDATVVQASRIMIAWKNTREGRRAVLDAIPFLTAAQTVTIVAVCEAGMERATTEQIAELAKYLAHHKVAPVSPHVIPANSTPAEHVLLDVAKARNADLIVAGAYGRTRLSEWVFGGFTRHLLRTSTIPCLFSN